MRNFSAGNDGRILDSRGIEVGVLDSTNVLERDPVPGPGLRVIDSGWIEGEAHRAWGPEAWARFLRAWDAFVQGVWEAGGEALLRPAAGHVIGDAPRAGVFLRERPGARLALEPSALLTPSMRARGADHLGRLASSFEPRRVALVVMGGEEEEVVRLAYPEAGVVVRNGGA